MDTRRHRNPKGEGARLRDDLVKAASTLLATGTAPEAMSMRAVARQAGVAPQSVYLHFADKPALMVAVYQTHFGGLLDDLAAATGDTPRDRLEAICHAYYEYAQAQPGHYQVMFGTSGTPGWKAEQATGMVAWKLLRAAVADCRADAVDEVTACLWAGLHGLIVLRRDRPNFPWPPIGSLIRTLVDDHTRTPLDR